MNDFSPKERSAAVAAGIILIVFAIGFFMLPNVMLLLGNISPWLAAVVGVLFVLSFFFVFWLRARYQRRR